MLTKLDGVTSYYNALKTYALNQALLGKEVPNYKVVEGRSTRAFKDIDAVFEKVKAAGFDESVLYERKPLTLTGIETLLGKPEFNKLLADDIIKPPGKPTLVPAADKREAYTGKTSAEDDFKNIQL